MNDRRLAKTRTETCYTLDELGRCPSSRKTSGMSRARGDAKRDAHRASRRDGRAAAREAKSDA